jgi:hypothetical protein
VTSKILWQSAEHAKKVKVALFLATKKSTVKATIVLSDLVSNLTRSRHFDENDILTEEHRRKYAAMLTMFERASTCVLGAVNGIKGMIIPMDANIDYYFGIIHTTSKQVVIAHVL